MKRSISSARVSRGGRWRTSSRPPQAGQRGCGSSSVISWPQARQTCQLAGRCVWNFIPTPPVDSISRAPARSTGATRASLRWPGRGVRRRHRRRHPVARGPPARERERRRAAPRDRAPERPRGERCRLGLGEAREQPRAGRLGDPVVDGAAQQLVVAERERGDERPHLGRLVQRRLQRDRRREHRAGLLRAQLLLGADEHHHQLGRHREAGRRPSAPCIGSARCRRAARARCCRGAARPPSPRRRGRRRASACWSSGAPEQRVDRHRARHRRRGAARPGRPRAAAPSAPRARCPARRRAARPPRRAPRARRARRCAAPDPAGASGWPGSRITMPGSRVHSARTASPAPSTARPRMSSPGPTLPTPPGREGGDRAGRRHAPARRRMSFRTPAAVTSAPAPGTGDDQRVGLVARGGEDQLVVRALDGGERARGRHRPEADRDLGRRDRGHVAQHRARRPRRRRPAGATPRRAPAAARRTRRRDRARAHLGTSDSTAARDSSPG